MIIGVVFDLDHTLFDRYATLTRIAPRLCHDHPEWLSEDLSPADVADRLIAADRQYIHFGWTRLHRHLSDTGFFQMPVSAGEYTEYILGQFEKIAVPFDFTLPMLEELQRCGYKTGLITNGRAQLQKAKLTMLGLSQCFDQIIISGDFGADKPDRSIFTAMADALSARPDQLLYVGDHPLNDVQASRNAGYIPVWVKTTGSWVMPEIAIPPLVVETVAEIPSLLQNLDH